MARRHQAITVGARIRAHRIARKLSQRAFAEQIGRDASEVCRWERGERIPDAVQVEAIAKACGVSMPDFYGALPSLEA